MKKMSESKIWARAIGAPNLPAADAADEWREMALRRELLTPAQRQALDRRMPMLQPGQKAA